MKGSYCDEFYEACKADFFCSSTGTGSFFDTVADECGTLGDIQSNCKSFEELYGSGEALCEKMWDDSFIYVPTTNFSDPDHNASDAFVWDWPANETNPNAAVLDHVEWPDSCNESEHDAWVEFDLKALEECPNVISDGTTGNVTNATGGYNP
uniref:Folate receptor-like domain-containing protein n=1 Tax=Prasinoderma coloniale TaxID=156133 RepID=A0A7R9Y0Y9_9VIRI|mmetsp:Transcript_2982/g.12068  ORF Transcript_2982/g.12068 Transcript_2982/m.12068 type:complete len:152 (+) Transcript_2982:860-1315(+)